MERKELRNGYTTGTCAAAAAKAAAVFVLTGNVPENVHISLPSGETCCFHPEAGAGEYEGYFRVQKDAGDDPDVTDGVWVYGAAVPVTREQFEELKVKGSGYWMEDTPFLYLTGERGIGIVTKPGLSCPVGRCAVNPVPRGMILGAVDQTCRQAAFEGFLEIRIAIPEGVSLAEKTFNPKLGIEGGISVLGTTGIVKPMSEDALKETIRLEIHMQAAAGKRILLMAPGNYGESFLNSDLGVPVGKAVLCSNFVQTAVKFAVNEGIQRLLFAGHIGKLIKVAAGVGNTHSRFGDGRMEEMALLAEEILTQRKYGSWCVELDQESIQALCSQILRANTTDEALGLLMDTGAAGQVLHLAAEKAKRHMQSWSGGKLTVEAAVFSTAHQIVGMTDQLAAYLALWKSQEGYI